MRFTYIYSLLTEDKLGDELARSALSQEQKEKVREINAKLKNKTKFISWLVANIEDIPEDVVELLNWFQSDTRIDNKDIYWYHPEALRKLHDDMTRPVKTKDGEADLVLQRGPVTVYKAKSSKWLLRNFKNTGWCVSRRHSHEKNFDTYTSGRGDSLYILQDESKIPYSRYRGNGDPLSHVCIGVDRDGMLDEWACSDARGLMNMAPEKVVQYLKSVHIDPAELGINQPTTSPASRQA